jgi:hypothetical protein
MKLPKSWEPAKLPEKIGDCIDLALRARAKRKALQAKMDVLEAEERRMKEYIIITFKHNEIDGAKGKMGSAAISKKDVPKVVDKELFGKWVAKHKAWDLLYGKAVEEACSLRWEEGLVIDGIEKFHNISVKLTEK